MRLLLLAVALICGLASPARAAETPREPSVVHVVWKENATVALPGVTHVVVLDDRICVAEASQGEIRLTGVMVGDTVLFAWVDGVRVPLVVRVAPKPDPPRKPTLSASGSNALGRGTAGTSLMIAGDSSTPVVTHEYWDWRQARDGSRLSVRGFTNTYRGASHAFNLGSFAIEHATATRTLSLMDFTLNLGASGVDSPSLSSYGSFGVRGADLALTRGRNRLELFAGSTVPAFFLSFAGTRSIAGAKLDRTVTPALRLFTTLGMVAAPAGATSASVRSVMPFQTAGIAYTPSTSFSLKATAGTSTRGLLGDVQADYVLGHFIASAGAADAASGFPLNRVQLLTAGESSLRASGTLAWTALSLTTGARHSVSKPGGLAVLQGSSDTVSQSIQLTLPRRQQFSGNFTRGATSGSVLASSRNTRTDGSWSSGFGARINNTLYGGLGRVTESSQLNSYREFTLRDSLNVTLPFGGFSAAFEHQRLDPSTPGRIRQVLDSLPAELRDLFQLDPVLFLNTVDLPPDVRRLLEAVQPTSTSLSLGAQYARGRISINPTFTVLSDTLNGTAARRSYTLGYSAAWRLAPTWQLRSSLNSRVLYAGPGTGFRRSNVVTFGLDKSLSGLPHWLAPLTGKYSIEGRVFRDNSGNGELDPTEPGLAAVRVRLDDGRVVVTDKQGRYRFKDVKPGMRHISIDLARLPGPVRVTTPSEVDVEVVEPGVRVNFGVVNFARVIGTVFNDYHNDGNRQSDAPGLPRVRVRLTGVAGTTVVTSDSSGDFEAADLPPGDYELNVAADDLPADYVVAAPSTHVHVEPIATVVADLPVRALRSISGRVLLKGGADQGGRLEPVAGVLITAGGVSATTDAEGRYALRGLPAGPVEIRVVPVRDVPEHLRAPFGVVRLKPEPTRIENANIIISNPELIEYVTGQATAPARRTPTK